MGEFALLIPILALLIPIVAIISTNIRKVHERKLDMLANQTAGLADEADARIRRLEARVQVLERIATDKRIGLADEIDSLVDERAAAVRRPTTERRMGN